MSHIRHYRVFSRAKRLLSLLESIAKHQTGKSPKRTNRLSSDFLSSSSSSSSSASHRDSTITAGAFTTIQTQNNRINH